MSLDNTDFILTPEQLQRLNQYIARLAASQQLAGEPSPSSLTVQFEWIAGLGRRVIARLDGHVDGCEIEDFF